MIAVLLADVVGYSRLMSTDEDATHVMLTECFGGLIDPKIAEHGGRLIRSSGDGLLVEFDSVWTQYVAASKFSKNCTRATLCSARSKASECASA